MKVKQINTQKSLFKPLRYYKFDLNKYVYYKILILGSIVTFEFTLKLLLIFSYGLVQLHQEISFQEYLPLMLGENLCLFILVSAKFIANILTSMLPPVLDVQKVINMRLMQLYEDYITLVRSDCIMLRPLQVCPEIIHQRMWWFIDNITDDILCPILKFSMQSILRSYIAE